jgi:histidyl-tRNA synthetase
MTPTVARMVAAKRRELGFPLRLYCVPNFFRYERPQRGRLREFWQLNVDLFGSHSPVADAEIIATAYGLMGAFGATESDFIIKVGNRAHLNLIADNFGLSNEQHKQLLGFLDRRAKIPAQEFDAGLAALGIPAEAVSSDKASADIADMIEEFHSAGINNIVYDSGVVRGFQYYTGMVFEVFDTHPENNRALFGGGRYDNLTALFDDEPLPGVGFGMGLETLRLFMEARGLLPAYRPPTHAYIAIPHPELAREAQAFAGELRAAGVNVAVDFGEKKLAEQIKTASKHKIPFLIVVGEHELASGQFVVRDLASGEEKTLNRAQLAEFFLNL